VSGTVNYWQYTNPSNKGSVSASPNITPGQTAPLPAQMPASFTSGMKDGTVVAWQAVATDGKATDGSGGGGYSATSATCYFAVYPNSPDPPTITPGFNPDTTQPAVGSQITFTITQSANDTAKQFVWGLDQQPPTTGSIPAARTCTTGGATASCTKITSGTATLTITVPSPGPHDLWVYEQDTAGNDSGAVLAPGAADLTDTFTGAADPAVTYNAKSTLAGNFADALAAGKAYDNKMISASSGASCGATSGDGVGNNFSAADLAAAGWGSGKTVTVDGASFTLPGFGSCSGPDNLLAANQTIDAGNAQGSAVVFLAAASYSFAKIPGTVTGAPDSGLLTADRTAPAVAGGAPVVGSGCTAADAFDTDQSGCVPASGTVNYAPGCAVGSQTSFDLTVPDWWQGPSDIAAATFPHVIEANGTVLNQTVKVYAFAVWLDAACPVTSVTLPDVAGSVSTDPAPGVAYNPPGLHIFGLALRNTTTATPETAGAAPASPAGNGWTGAFESPIEDAYTTTPGVTSGNQTMRIALSPSISAPAGAQIRIRLSDPGFLSADGTGPLSIGAATIAQQYGGPIPAQAPVALSFGGSTSVTVPEGGDVYSDPLTLPFPVTAGRGLLVSVWLKNASLPVLPVNAAASGALTWFAPSSAPNQTGDTTGSPFTGTGSSWIGGVPLLAGVDVTTPAVTLNGLASPGAPTLVVAGDNVTDGLTAQAPSDALNEPSQRLAGQLASQPIAAGYAVVDAGIQSNQVLADGTAGGGVGLLSRADRDILAEPDTGTVIIDEGLQDLVSGAQTSYQTMENAYQALEPQLSAFGITVIIGTITPCGGYQNTSSGDSCAAAVDSTRVSVNGTIGNTAPYCRADFDMAVADPATVPPASPPEKLLAAYDAGDHVNLTLGAAGSYAKLASAVTASGCTPSPNSYPLPPP
jgi:hypothetical protein